MSKKIKIIISVIFGVAFVVLLTHAGLTLYLQKEGVIPTVSEEATTEGEKITVEKNFLGWEITAPRSVSLILLTNKAKEIANFRVYYPSFVPSEFLSDPIKINIRKDLDFADCSLGNVGEEESKWIVVMQQPIKPDEENPLLQQARILKSEQEISFNGNEGYTGFMETAKDKFNNLIYSTKDNVAIRIYSKDFDADTILQIAKSMK